MKIGFQGIAGSYSESAAYDYIKEIKLQADLIGYDSFQAIIDDIASRKIDMGILPVENSTTGLITRTLDLFKGRPVFVVGEIYEEVRHTLWGVDGSSISDLEEVYSHPEALGQSQRFFDENPHIRGLSYTDTAQSAKMVAALADKTKGALASPRCGQLYGLIPLKREIQTEVTNTTRFFALEEWDRQRRPTYQIMEEKYQNHPERTRWFMYVETKHEPGMLVKLLNIFDMMDCNLEALNARPIPNRPFRYGFFIEVDVVNLAGKYELFYRNLKYASEHIQILGSFQPKSIRI